MAARMQARPRRQPSRSVEGLVRALVRRIEDVANVACAETAPRERSEFQRQGQIGRAGSRHELARDLPSPSITGDDRDSAGALTFNDSGERVELEVGGFVRRDARDHRVGDQDVDARGVS